jgi:dTDP-4-dehydrorhamnose 3,5-epimerase
MTSTVEDSQVDAGPGTNFSVRALRIPEVLVIRATKFEDHRGYFMETWSQEVFSKFGVTANFVQDNESHSRQSGTLRGLHFQRQLFEQAKLVRVLRGAVFDVAVDLRPSSPTFRSWCAATLTAEAGEQLYVPRGFAHGFVTLERNTIVTYKVDASYAPRSEGGIRWDDPALAINWPVEASNVIISEKDRRLPLFSDACSQQGA